MVGVCVFRGLLRGVAEEVATVILVVFSHEISPSKLWPQPITSSSPTGDGSFEKLLLAQILRIIPKTIENLILEASLSFTATWMRINMWLLLFSLPNFAI